MLVTIVKQYEAVAKKVLGPVAMQVAGHQVQRLLGFWVLWHMMGSVEGMRLVGLAENSIYRNKKEFEQVFKCKVEDFLPELSAAIRESVKPSE
jgi:hypothetical protein